MYGDHGGVYGDPFPKVKSRQRESVFCQNGEMELVFYLDLNISKQVQNRSSQVKPQHYFTAEFAYFESLYMLRNVRLSAAFLVS